MISFKCLYRLSIGLAERFPASLKDAPNQLFPACFLRGGGTHTQLTPRDQLLWAVVASTIKKKKKGKGKSKPDLASGSC